MASNGIYQNGQLIEYTLFILDSCTHYYVSATIADSAMLLEKNVKERK